MAKEFDMAIKTLEQEPCEDCISRQAILNEIENYPHINNMDDIIEIIKNADSVKPKSKTGHWIYDYTTADGHKTYHCSECGCYLKPKHSEPLSSFKWCSWCGTKMEGKVNE